MCRLFASLDDQTARVEISILLERKLAILFGKHLTAGRGVDRPSSVQIRSLRRGRLHNEKYQQHQRIEGSHETLQLDGNRLPDPFDRRWTLNRSLRGRQA